MVREKWESVLCNCLWIKHINTTEPDIKEEEESHFIIFIIITAENIFF